MRKHNRSPWKLLLTAGVAVLSCLVPTSASLATQPESTTSSPSLTGADATSAHAASMGAHQSSHGHGNSPANRLAVRVRDNRLVGWRGAEVRLLGVNRSGTQYACAEGSGIFEGPTDGTALSRIAAWGANAVRVPLNESCWLGINGVDPAYSGDTYRTAIREYVDRLNAAGLRVILDLHWTAPGEAVAREQQPMADRDHAPDFWRGVAQEFKHNRSVVFDLFNEPYPDSNTSPAAAWECVRDGGTCPGIPYVAAGMQELVDAVRATGARNVLMIGGPQYAGTLEKWTDYQPHDPSRQMAASIHIYYNTPASPDWSPCYRQSCWEATIAELARTTPVVIGELGERDCASGLIDGTAMTPPQESLLDWADAHDVSYLAWGWTTSDCAGEPALISDYDGTPTAYGAGIRLHLLSVAAQERRCGRRGHAG
jgi:hypothetical protein